MSYVWLKKRWVAYPFQNNISALDKEDQVGSRVLIELAAFIICLQACVLFDLA